MTGHSEVIRMPDAHGYRKYGQQEELGRFADKLWTALKTLG